MKNLIRKVLCFTLPVMAITASASLTVNAFPGHGEKKPEKPISKKISSQKDFLERLRKLPQKEVVKILADLPENIANPIAKEILGAEGILLVRRFRLKQSTPTDETNSFVSQQMEIEQENTLAPQQVEIEQESTPAPQQVEIEQESTPAPQQVEIEQESTPAPINYMRLQPTIEEPEMAVQPYAGEQSSQTALVPIQETRIPRGIDASLTRSQAVYNAEKIVNVNLCNLL